MTMTIGFPAKVTLVHARTLLSIENFSFSKSSLVSYIKQFSKDMVHGDLVLA